MRNRHELARALNGDAIALREAARLLEADDTAEATMKARLALVSLQRIDDELHGVDVDARDREETEEYVRSVADDHDGQEVAR